MSATQGLPANATATSTTNASSSALPPPYIAPAGGYQASNTYQPTGGANPYGQQAPGAPTGGALNAPGPAQYQGPQQGFGYPQQGYSNPPQGWQQPGQYLASPQGQYYPAQGGYQGPPQGGYPAPQGWQQPGQYGVPPQGQYPGQPQGQYGAPQQPMYGQGYAPQGAPGGWGAPPVNAYGSFGGQYQSVQERIALYCARHNVKHFTAADVEMLLDPEMEIFAVVDDSGSMNSHMQVNGQRVLRSSELVRQFAKIAELVETTGKPLTVYFLCDDQLKPHVIRSQAEYNALFANWTPQGQCTPSAEVLQKVNQQHGGKFLCVLLTDGEPHNLRNAHEQRDFERIVKNLPIGHHVSIMLINDDKKEMHYYHKLESHESRFDVTDDIEFERLRWQKHHKPMTDGDYPVKVLLAALNNKFKIKREFFSWN